MTIQQTNEANLTLCDGRFRLTTTEDGSPSLMMTSDLEYPETMHSKMGAVSESFYVYGPVVREVLQQNWKPCFLSLGLGLAYNEMITVALVLQHARVASNSKVLDHLEIVSLESVDALKAHFIFWLERPFDMTAPAKARALKTEPLLFSNIFNEVCARVVKECGLSAADVHHELARLWKEKRLILGPALTPQLLTSEFMTFEVLTSEFLSSQAEASDKKSHQLKFSGIFYDAFSSKTNPELWSEAFLNLFLEKAAAPSCAFATYAAKGVLRRCLLDHQFDVSRDTGFGYKREKTFARRK